jgi:L-ascorbate metabolism protein UlaG (beta-lactamase superfamily)
MDIQFYGANCLSISAQGTRVVIDDNLATLGGKSILKAGDIALFTSETAAPAIETKLTVAMPGEYEIANISVYGLPARAHMDEAGQTSATIYKVIAGDIRFLALGHVHPEMSDRELEQIGPVDVIAVPVGGHGFTLDATGAMELVRRIEPKLVIPTYYGNPKLTYPMPAQTLDEALQTFGMEPSERTSKLRLKPNSFSDTMQLVVLEAS